MLINKLMKQTLLLLAASVLLSGALHAHEGIELGPNGGRIVEFSKDESLHGEVTLKDGHFQVRLLDKDLKPVALRERSLTVAGGDRGNPQRPMVEKRDDHFVFRALEGESYPLVLQLRADAGAKPITARFTFDPSTCSACKHPEWLCQCDREDAKKPAK